MTLINTASLLAANRKEILRLEKEQRDLNDQLKKVIERLNNERSEKERLVGRAVAEYENNEISHEPFLRSVETPDGIVLHDSNYSEYEAVRRKHQILHQYATLEKLYDVENDREYYMWSDVDQSWMDKYKEIWDKESRRISEALGNWYGRGYYRELGYVDDSDGKGEAPQALEADTTSGS